MEVYKIVTLENSANTKEYDLEYHQKYIGKFGELVPHAYKSNAEYFKDFVCLGFDRDEKGNFTDIDWFHKDDLWNSNSETYLDKRLKEIDEIGAYNVNGRKELFTKQLIEQGFHDGDTFTLWSHLTELILPRLKRFKELNCCHPGSLNSLDEWNLILDKMILAFELLLEDKFIYPEDEENNIDEGLNLFGEWFRNLWW